MQGHRRFIVERHGTKASEGEPDYLLLSWVGFRNGSP
jgi:hypothetical protein